MKILILKPSSLGDVVQALPVLRLAKRRWPAAEIFWWIDEGIADLLRGDPDLAGLFLFRRKRWGKPWHWPEMIASIREMRAHRFDLVLDLQGLLRSGGFAWLAGGARTIGVDDLREGARAFYDAAVARPGRLSHAVDWYLAVARAAGIPTDAAFEWLPERPVVEEVMAEKWSIGAHRWVILNPGARWLNKRWPAEHFAAAVCLLAREFPNVRFAILGGREDAPLAEQIAATLPERCLNLAGQTSLMEMVEWIRLAEVVVTNDTGPMHVAAALRKPLVGLFGPTEPRRTGPYGQLANCLQLSLPCVPCMKGSCAYEKPRECLRAITPAVVAQRVAAMLRGVTVPAS
ncbi:MAG: lipopolysaccharide heptosyltransferase II [Verrucomicrobia bacterium]|nr:lipopolysaccharide heptosyltransferase II [Verrucomicrobiota bacterium]